MVLVALTLLKRLTADGGSNLELSCCGVIVAKIHFLLRLKAAVAQIVSVFMAFV